VIYANSSLPELLSRFRLHIGIALQGDDSEGIHQIRVATRRLRVLLKLMGIRVLQDDLCWLSASVGEARDLDVLIKKAEINAYHDWLQEQRLQYQTVIALCLGSSRLDGLLEAFDGLCFINIKIKKAAYKKIKKTLLIRSKKLSMVDCCDENIHSVRKSLRQLRYAREFLNKDVSVQKELQEVFGDFNDACVMLERWKQFPHENDYPEMTHRLQSRYNELRRQALESWQKK
jgi:CHAD domain-containing protein